MKKQLKKGFTLTELVIVIVIIAILAAVLIPSMTGYVNRAKKSSNEQTAESIATVFQAWLIDESDKLSYAYAQTQTGKSIVETGADFNATLDGAKKAGDIVSPTVDTDTLKVTVNKQALDVTSLVTVTLNASGATKVGNSSTAGTEVTISVSSSAITVTKVGTTSLTSAVTVATSDLVFALTDDGAKAYNAKLDHAKAVDASVSLFYAYYLESSEENWDTADKITNVSATGFTYTGSKYATKVTYAAGAFTYETTEAK